ncbi:MAG: proton-conducting membrane transporter [Clostridia bacterium]|nr:proton-conducting membrane transporter [Clostridia bacterium]
MMLILVLLPALAALSLTFIKSKKVAHIVTLTSLIAEAIVSTIALIVTPSDFVLFSMTDILTIAFRIDSISKIFMSIASYGFLIAGIYAFKYMEHDTREQSFLSFYLLSQAALMGMDFSKNLITMYLFFEMITLLSMPLVLHDRSKEAVAGALKYLFYSIAGAFLALGCIFFISQYTTTLDFAPGGNLDATKLVGHETLLLIAVFLGVIGFGAKAGMYPLHGWLPTAHPVAPAPASAVLSGIIAKAGVLAIIRVIYFSVGVEFLKDTWVQYTWISLALLTVFMGSMMAFREKIFKKRLAYSSVSQISYILVGLFFLTPESAMGGLLHVIFHATIKICLFMVAGSFIHNTEKTRVDEFVGYGKSMPKTLWGFTIASLALIGIPPASGFVSKWYLALGSLGSGINVLSWLAPVILLISALLTAGYLLPITVSGFFPGKDASIPEKNKEGGLGMIIPILTLAAISLLLGIFSGPIVEIFNNIASSMF